MEAEKVYDYLHRLCQEHVVQQTVDLADSPASAFLFYYGNQTIDYPNGKFVANEQEAKDKLKDISREVKNSDLEVLSNRIPIIDHRKNCATADILQWLMKTNSVREFLFNKPI